MIYDIILILFIAVCAAFFSYFLDYSFGKPGAKDLEDVNTKAILFFWSYFLAARRAKNIVPDLLNVDKKDVFGIGRDLFTWEFAFGMCIFCTNFWVCELLFAIPFIIFHPVNLVVIPKFFLLLTIPIFSHFILRKI